MLESTLSGRRIGVAESRELDIFAAMLERRGAEVLRCPLIAILDAPDPRPIIHWIEGFCANSCDDLILLTGEGLRRLLGCIDRNRPELREPFVARLDAVRKITRGPKPARALRELGYKPDIAAEIATTQGIIDVLKRESLRERRVGVQLYGSDPNRPLIDFLESAGAHVLAVAPYVYADRADADAVREFLAQIASGSVDAVAFTSMAQVRRLISVAGEDATRTALAKTHVAAVGPVVAEALREAGITVDSTPADSYFMKPLVAEIEDAYRAAAGK